MQNVGGLAHLHHERAAAAGEVVAGADAGEDAVDWAKFGVTRRHRAADVCHQRRQRHLAHPGRLATHVRSGDQQQPPVLGELAVVGDEMLDAGFHHRVAAVAQQQSRRCAKLRCHPAQRVGAFGQRRRRVQPRQCPGQRLQTGDVRLQRLQQRLVKLLFAHQRALARRQGAVLERLQLRRQVALDVFQRLPAAVIGRQVVGVGPPDLDVKAVHAVVFDLERGNAGALALARLQRQQKTAAVAIQRAQLVQLGVGAAGDDTTVLEADRRLFGHQPHQLRQRKRWRNQLADDCPDWRVAGVVRGCVGFQQTRAGRAGRVEPRQGGRHLGQPQQRVAQR